MGDTQRPLWDFHVTVRGRWWRSAALYGEAPGSHTGFWRTSYGDLRGWNYRVGSLRRCLTVLVHTRAVRQDAASAVQPGPGSSR